MVGGLHRRLREGLSYHQCHARVIDRLPGLNPPLSFCFYPSQVNTPQHSLTSLRLFLRSTVFLCIIGYPLHPSVSSWDLLRGTLCLHKFLSALLLCLRFSLSPSSLFLRLRVSSCGIWSSPTFFFRSYGLPCRYSIVFLRPGS